MICCACIWHYIVSPLCETNTILFNTLCTVRWDLLHRLFDIHDMGVLQSMLTGQDMQQLIIVILVPYSAE